MKISVIIPTFKPQKYICDSIYSLYNQNLDLSLFEVIVVLNGERDPYDRIIKEQVNEIGDPMFNFVFIYTKYIGVSNARNIGIDIAKGEYICFVDDDDVVSNSFLEELLKKSTGDSIVVSNVKQLNFHTNKLEQNYLETAYSKLNCSEAFSLFKFRKFFSSACCKLIPRDLIGKNRFNIRQSVGEDAFFMASISNRVKKVSFSSENCIYYIRARGNSLSRNKDSKLTLFKKRLPLIFDYIYLYCKNFPKYNFLFIMTRILATIKIIIK